VGPPFYARRDRFATTAVKTTALWLLTPLGETFSRHARGVPILAECGGMMVLTSALIDMEGRPWPMTALLSGTTRMRARLAGPGPQAVKKLAEKEIAPDQ
jgi:cobyrinic acid a,c-diamide synthase